MKTILIFDNQIFKIMFFRALFLFSFSLIIYPTSILGSNKLSDIDLSSFPIKLSGYLDSRNITMYIVQNEEKIEGIYYYKKSKVYLKIKGVLEQNGIIKLKEFNSKGSNTGEFNGRIGSSLFSGQWKKPDGSIIHEFIMDIKYGAINTTLKTISDNELPNNKSVKSKKSWNYVALFFILTIGIVLFKKLSKYLKKNNGKTQLNENTYAKENDAQTEKSRKIGRDFENYIASILNNTKNYLTIEDWRGDKHHNGISARSNTYPDFKVNLKYQDVNVDFAIECKYRTNISTKFDFEICGTNQLENYRAFAKKYNLEVFVVIGSGGSPSDPLDMYIIPLRDIKYNTIPYLTLKKFKTNSERERFFYKINTKDLVLIKMKESSSTGVKY